jgi:hypothetical protein
LIQILGVRALIWFISLFASLEHSAWDHDIVKGLHFIENSVLQVPFFLMSLMRYVTPTLDNMFVSFQLDLTPLSDVQKVHGVT